MDNTIHAHPALEALFAARLALVSAQIRAERIRRAAAQKAVSRG